MKEIFATCEVAEAVVYPDRARLTAASALDLDVGDHRIIIQNLPLLVIRESVRVSGQGVAKVQIASVDVRRSFYERTPVAKVREIEDQIRDLGDERQVLTDEESILHAQREYLDGLRKATVQYAKGLARGKTKIEDYARLADFLADHDRALRASVRDLDIKKRDLADRLEKLNSELNELNTGRTKQGYQAVVDLVAESGGTFNLALSYLIRKSSWRPLYDIRLTEAAEGQMLDITILAEINQSTGEDWNGVKMSVSTSRPALSQRAPELKPWYIDEARPMPTPQPQSVTARMRAPAVALAEDPVMGSGAVDALPHSQVAAEAQVARKDTSGPSTTFHIAGRSDIPGDGSPHKTTIGRYSISPEIDYLAVPKQVDAVYKRVKILNETDSPLLAGKVNLFAGADFIGSVDIDHTAPGDELELLFGTEERIAIERELTLREVEKTRLRDRRELSYGYEVKVRNLLSDEAKIEVQDNIPVARHEEIKVSLEKSTPEPSDHNDLNIIKWELVVPPETEKSIQYEYVISHPRQMRVIGLIE